MSVGLCASQQVLGQADKRYVLTGGPGVGKTTLIAEFAKRGYQTIPEIYALLYEQATRTNTLDTFFNDPITLYESILDEQIEWESKLAPGNKAFLDRSTLDIIAFGEYFKVSLSQEVCIKTQRQYDLIFFLEPLPEHLYEQCLKRKETRQEALKLHEIIRATYIENGYSEGQLIDVPFGTPQERVEYILNVID